MTITDPGLIDWRERQYVSQFSQPELGFTIYIGGQPADPDGSAMTARLMMQNADGTLTLVSSYTAARSGPGAYTVTPSSADTQHPGLAELDWSYAVSGQPQQYASYLEIGPASPPYDSLPQEMQDFLNDQVWVRFSDLFDSAGGGPNLQSYFQAHWSRGRVAQMMGIALMKINAVGQPWSNYTLDGNGGPQYPVQFWGGLLSSYCYIECVKQLIRSYTEQPAFSGPGIARQDRRDYADRWREALKDEEAELKSLLDVFKIRHILNGSPRVLVSGGTYGRYAPTRIAGSVAARPRMWARWYLYTTLSESDIRNTCCSISCYGGMLSRRVRQHPGRRPGHVHPALPAMAQGQCPEVLPRGLRGAGAVQGAMSQALPAAARHPPGGGVPAPSRDLGTSSWL